MDQLETLGVSRHGQAKVEQHPETIPFLKIHQEAEMHDQEKLEGTGAEFSKDATPLNAISGKVDHRQFEKNAIREFDPDDSRRYNTLSRVLGLKKLKHAA